MVSLLARAGMTIASSGATSPLTLGNALGAVAPNLCSFMDLATAGAVDGKTYRYLILDSNGNWEIGKGIYTAAGTTLTRSVQYSSNGNAAIAMTSSAQIFVVPIPDDVISVTDDQTALFTQSEKAQARLNIGAAPIEALADNVLNSNSGAEVSQENGNTAVTLTATSSLQTKYIVDGFMAAYRGTFVATAQQVTDAPPGIKNAVKFTVGTAQASIGTNDELSVLAPVEGGRCAKLAFGATGANALAVWFWVKAHRTGQYSGSLRNSAKTRAYPFSFKVNAADTWEYKSLIIPGDTTGTWLTDTGVGIYLNICIAGGASRVGSGGWAGADYSGLTSTTNGVAATTDVFTVTGVGTLPLISGVSAGDIPDSARAAFLVRHFTDELRLCKRAYQKSYEYQTAIGASTHLGMVGGPLLVSTYRTALSIGFEVEMLRVPSVKFYDGAGTLNCNSQLYDGSWTNGESSVVIEAPSPKGFIIKPVVSTLTAFIHYTADARLS